MRRQPSLVEPELSAASDSFPASESARRACRCHAGRPSAGSIVFWELPSFGCDRV